MEKETLILSVASSSNTPNPRGMVVTLESVEIVLAIIVSLSILAGIAIRIISKINTISLSIIQIEETLKEQTLDAKKLQKLEHNVDLHIQAYLNKNDVTQMLLGQLDQKINHKFKRLLFYTRDIQRYLAKDTCFIIREYEENTEEE